VTHTLVFHDGAETLDRSRANSTAGAVTMETTITRYGRGAYRYAPAGDVRGHRYRPRQAADGTWDATGISHFWISVAFYVVTFPAAGQSLVVLRMIGGAAMRSQVYFQSADRKLRINSPGGTDAGAVALSAGKWYILSYRHLQNSTVSFIVRDADTGATVDSLTHSFNAPNSTTDEIWLVNAVGADNGDIILDNFVMENDNASANIDDPVNLLTHKYACGLLVPDGTGFYNAWSGSWADVDETPHDSSTTARLAGAAGTAFTQDLKATSTLVAQVGTVYSTMALDILNGGIANQNAKVRLRSGATDSDSTDTTDISAGSYECRQKLYLTDPATAGSWTVSAIDSVQVGAVATDGNQIRCTLCGLEILYTVGAITRTKVVAYVMDDYDPERRVFDARTGEELPYEEVQPNVGWLRVTSGDMPDSASPDNAWEDDTLLPIDSVRYSQDASGASLDIIPSSEGLAEQLIRGLANSSGSL
jgi:hypothetical protein